MSAADRMDYALAADHYKARQRLVAWADKHGLIMAQQSIYERPTRVWWPFPRRIAAIRLWQHGVHAPERNVSEARNRLNVTRIHDTTELRLLLGYANLIGWEIIEGDAKP